MKKNDDDALLRRMRFSINFNKIIKKEKSPISKMVLQENYICFTLRGIIIFFTQIKYLSVLFCFSNIKKLDRKMINTKHWDTGYYSFMFKRELNNHTLGNLIILLETVGVNFFITGKLLDKLKEYNVMRNKITHKIFDNYTDEKQMNKDAKKVIRIGNEVIKYSSQFAKKLFRLEKILFVNNNPVASKR